MICKILLFPLLLGVVTGNLVRWEPPGERAATDANQPLAWWQQTIIYQIYPRSFMDSDGDGIGDLNGITSKLDYFVDLGVQTIWLCPIYQSPMKDFGYDISNFTNIEPTFGTLDDFKRMADEFHKRGLKLVMDMVPNHSSDLHPWFQQSIEKIEPYTDYYVWKDPKGFDANGKPIPPNNWIGVFGGSMWEWNEKRQQFYLHQFLPEQPDLNYENIKVRTEILAVVKFWLDHGVDGLRVDAVPFLYEDKEWRDEPENPDRDPAAKPEEYGYWLHPYTYNLPEDIDYLVDMYRLLDVYSKTDGEIRCMMLEATVGDDYIMDYYGTPDRPASHFPFNFHLNSVRPNSKASHVLELINFWYDNMPTGAWASFQTGNHDVKRAATRWTEAGIDSANMINLLLQGVPITYYGEEIGMTDTFLTWEETQDPQACRQDPERYQDFSRDPARTPFHWDNSTNAGFSSADKTWLPLNPQYKDKNVAAQLRAPESHLKVYKALAQLRQTDTWRYGSYQSRALHDDQVVAFTRIPRPGDLGYAYLVIVNVMDESLVVDATVLSKVPILGRLKIKSIDSGLTAGSLINLREIQLGPRNSLVIEFAVTQ